MTIWELLTKRSTDDLFVIYDDTVDASVDIVNIAPDYEEGVDNYEDFLHALFSRINLTEEPSSRENEGTASFYDFFEEHLDVFEPFFELSYDDDPSALLVEYLNDICAGGMSDKDYRDIAKAINDID